ncbi:uncharacterized protein LOC135499343 [Lineus longissimus]|uniref:uncharacterized protein LOC135499343 n=1 Tax=Lineus longissimus TaxID=88925 RepID=UPI00315CD5ED
MKRLVDWGRQANSIVEQLEDEVIDQIEERADEAPSMTPSLLAQGDPDTRHQKPEEDNLPEDEEDEDDFDDAKSDQSHQSTQSNRSQLAKVKAELAMLKVKQEKQRYVEQLRIQEAQQKLALAKAEDEAESAKLEAQLLAELDGGDYAQTKAECLRIKLLERRKGTVQVSTSGQGSASGQVSASGENNTDSNGDNGQTPNKRKEPSSEIKKKRQTKKVASVANLDSNGDNGQTPNKRKEPSSEIKKKRQTKKVASVANQATNSSLPIAKNGDAGPTSMTSAHPQPTESGMEREVNSILDRERQSSATTDKPQQFEDCELICNNELAALRKKAEKGRELQEEVLALTGQRNQLALRVLNLEKEKDGLQAELSAAKEKIKAAEESAAKAAEELAASASNSSQIGSSNATNMTPSDMPKAGVVNPEVAKQFKMKELVKGSGVYVYSQQKYIIKSATDLTYCLSAAMGTFYDKEDLGNYNLSGANGKKKLDNRIISAIADTAHHLFPEAKGKDGKPLTAAQIRSRLVQRCHDTKKDKRREGKKPTTRKIIKTKEYVIESESDDSIDNRHDEAGSDDVSEVMTNCPDLRDPGFSWIINDAIRLGLTEITRVLLENGVLANSTSKNLCKPSPLMNACKL